MMKEVLALFFLSNHLGRARLLHFLDLTDTATLQEVEGRNAKTVCSYRWWCKPQRCIG